MIRITSDRSNLQARLELLVYSDELHTNPVADIMIFTTNKLMQSGDIYDAVIAELEKERDRAKHICICNLPENYCKDITCPSHGKQRPDELCPECRTHVLGFCPQGCYCTDDDCRYVA